MNDFQYDVTSVTSVKVFLFIVGSAAAVGCDVGEVSDVGNLIIGVGDGCGYVGCGSGAVRIVMVVVQVKMAVGGDGISGSDAGGTSRTFCHDINEIHEFASFLSY